MKTSNMEYWPDPAISLNDQGITDMIELYNSDSRVLGS